MSAFAVSAVFLACYLVYHAALQHYTGSGSKKFEGVGLIRPVYYSILISHVFLAFFVAVLVPVTLWLGLKAEKTERLGLPSIWAKHRKLAKVTFPLWLYVSVTGVVIYFCVPLAEFLDSACEFPTEKGDMMWRRTIFLASVMVGAACFGPTMPSAQACPMCKVANEQDSLLPKAYMYSILFMMGMIFSLGGGVGFCMYRLSRKENAALEAWGQLTGSNGGDGAGEGTPSGGIQPMTA